MENISYKDEKNPTVVSEVEMYEIPFIKDKTYFMIFDNWVNFIKGVERTIRNSQTYTDYISHLKEMGLTKCQVLGNIDSNMSEKGHPVTVEMHHGPLFTLFDYVAIVIQHMLKNDLPINSIRVAKLIMDEHWAGNVQTVMLSATAHQSVDSGKLFISFKQAHGNLTRFIEKYRDGINENQMEKIHKYIQLSEEHKSTDNGLFELQETMKDWSRRRYV